MFERNESMIEGNERMIRIIKTMIEIKDLMIKNNWINDWNDPCWISVNEMSVYWTPMCEVLVSKMFVCAMPYVLVPVVLQWDVIVLDDCVPDVFVMGACRGCMFCMSVCIMYVCRIYILDVSVFDDCVAVVGVRHLCVFNAQIWNVCLQNVWDLSSSMALCGISICWMAEFSLCVSRISALDESLLYNCLECWMPKFRMSDCYVFVMGSCRGCLFCRSVCLMPKFDMSVCRMSVINVCFGNDCVALISF